MLQEDVGATQTGESRSYDGYVERFLWFVGLACNILYESMILLFAYRG